MFYLSLLVICLLGIGGLYVGIYGFNQYRNITRTVDKVSVLQVIKIAGMLGMSSSLVFFTIMISGGVINKEYLWSLSKLGGSIVVSLFLGILVTIGAAYQIYTTVVFRDILIRTYKAKNKPEDRSK